MTRIEFEQRVKDENLRMESYCIELNEYREEIHVMGCKYYPYDMAHFSE